jgi:glucosamine--fructose-6-phosphate aminotransferase (isomerizing)
MAEAESLMAREIAECPAVAARLIDDADRRIASLAKQLGRRRFAFAVVCGRGSSSHVGIYLRYVIERWLGLVVSAAAPSLVTAYERPPAMREALFLLISQSGRSPDLVAAIAAARQHGATTLAIVNDASSPAAAASEHVLALDAGTERSVAATKTVIGSLVAGLRLVAALAGSEDLLGALGRLPGRLEGARALDWSRWAGELGAARAAFVTARGHGFGAAREIALKLAETVATPAIAYSAAELRHGPRAALSAATPVLALRQNDASAASVDALVAELRASGVPTHLAGEGGDLPWLAPDHAALDPIAMLMPAYRAIEAAARARGLDPDRPRHLSKVTETL